jgi:uncharacterized protein YprB with RNaseH-like and TPR domain
LEVVRLVVLRELGVVGQLDVSPKSLEDDDTDLIAEQRPTWIETWMTRGGLEVVEQEPGAGMV